jgi:hypothetical protein
VSELAPGVANGPAGGEDDGLRKMLVWVAVALVLAVVAAALIAQLAIQWFDIP